MQRTRTLAPTAALAAALVLALPLRAEEAAAAAPAALSDADRQELIDLLETALAETDALVAQAEGERFTRKPAPDRWSVADVLEHLGLAEPVLFGAVESAVATPPDPAAAELLAGRPIADLVTTLTDRSQRFQAPDAMVPTGGKSREELIERYHAARAKTLEFVRTTQVPLGAHTADTPMGKMTAQHFVAFIAAHNMRHNKQIAEVLEQTKEAGATAGEAHHH